MTRKSRLVFTFLLVFSSTLFAATTQTDWTVGAQEFSFTRNQSDSVSQGIARMFPVRILEKLSSGLYRNVTQDELLARELYKINQDNNSLFLQLSAAVKKRDSLVTQNYSARELEKKIAEENKKIKEIKDKIAANIQRQKQTVEQASQSSAGTGSKNASDSTEKIILYNKDITSLFTPSATARSLGLNSAQFETELVKANINCLITGQITAYDEYMSLTVYAHVFPGVREIAVITEVGSVDDADLMAANIASKLSPAIANAMPCTIKITIENREALESVNTYIDDILFKNIDSEFTIDSGVHFIQFTAPGFKNAGTNYYFAGGNSYSINVSLQKTEPKTIYVGSLNAIDGSFLINGVSAQKLSDGKGKITINGSAVLGQFITEDKTSAFLYVPDSKVEQAALYMAKLKAVNHSDFIEKRRRQMYLSYSILVTSLVPTIITKGTVKSYKAILADTEKQKKIDNLDEKIKTANNWVLSSNISSAISIACGVWFVFELYRYFTAANSVLPQSTKISFDYVPAEPLPTGREQEAVEEDTAATEEAVAPEEVVEIIE